MEPEPSGPVLGRDVMTNDKGKPAMRVADQVSGSEAERGREAEHPKDIPVRGWTDVLWRIWQGINDKNLFLVAGGVTYSVLLALFPALIALVSIYGLVFDRSQVEKQVAAMSGILPAQANQLIGGEMHQIVTSSSGALGFGAIVGLLFAFWTASRGTSGLMSALDIAYGQKDQRSFIRFNLVAFALTLGLLIASVIGLALVAVLPAAVTSGSGGNGVVGWIALIVEWPVLAVFMMAVLAVLYRYAPDRNPAEWRWVTPGALVATVLWIVGSILFSVYVANFGSYNATYGSLGAVVVLLTWLYLTAFVVLLGADVNAEIERQTRKDSTVGPPKPMGSRGATAADTLGESYGRS